VIVDNRRRCFGFHRHGGAGESRSDGYTLGVVFDTHAVNPSLIPNLPSTRCATLHRLMLVGTGAMALVTPVAQPYKSFP
jgi:hypothetical protein